MSIVIRPGQFGSAGGSGAGVEPHPAGKLASTLLSVTVAGMADPPRFRRGKTYVKERAVTRLEVSTGTLRATVQGSRAEPYEAIVATRLVGRPAIGDAASMRTVLSQLVPDARDLMVSCSCPDWDDPCKHAVAALLAFADELVTRPELLLEWRCEPADGEGDGRPRVGQRAATGRHLRLAPEPPPERPSTRRLAPQVPAGAARATPGTPTPPAPPQNPYTTPEWQRFLGHGLSVPTFPDVPTAPAPVGHAMLGTIDISAWLRSAHDVLAADSN